MSTTSETTRTVNAASSLRWIGACGIALVIVVRATNIFAPQVLFDVDPALFPFALGFGPAGSLGLDVLLLLFAAIALLGETLAGRRIDALIVLLALMPLPVVLYHGLADGHHLWRGMTWVAAAVGAVAIAHVQRDRTIRVALLGVLVALIAPLLIRGAMQVTIEHADTLAAFEETREQFYADRGWTLDSPAARIYERRLRQPQPIAWFPTSNVLATVLLTTAVVWLGLGVAGIRQRASSGWVGVAFVMVILALAGIALSGSKGAIAAVTLGIVLVLVPTAMPSLGARLHRRALPIAVGLVALALIGVIARGLVVSEGFLNERSLLFRWHYLLGAGRMLLDVPFTGVGPDGFQAAYELHRPSRSPEEVTSAHSVFVDWIAMLGVLGVAWIGLVIVMLARTTRRIFMAEDQSDQVRQMTVGRFVVVVFGTAMLAGAVVQWATLQGDALTMLTRLLGFGAAMLLAATAARLLADLDHRPIAWAIVVAVTVLLVHAQIEMTFWQPGAVVWCFAMLGIAAGVPRLTAESPRVGRAAGGAIAIVACVTILVGFVPAWGQQRMVAAAASQLHVPEIDRPPFTTIERRIAAVDVLEAAYERWPRNVIPLHDAARQSAAAAGMSPPPDRVGHLERSLALLDRAIDDHDRNALRVERINVRRALADITGDTTWLEPATNDAATLTERSPHAIASWKRLGDLYWRLGRTDDAARAYERALENDHNFELDPLKRLSDDQRAEIERRAGAG